MNHAGFRPRRGMTLIELMIGLIIIGLALGYVFISVDSLTPRARIEKSCRDLGSGYVYARDRAITSGREVTFKIDLDKQEFFAVMNELDETDRITKETFESRLGGVERGVKLDAVFVGEERKTPSGEVMLVIQPNGISPGLVAQYSMDSNRLKFTVRINPITGVVQLYPEHLDGGFVKDSVLGG